MPKEEYIKPTRIALRSHPVLNERWLQRKIAEDPSLLGLGDLILKDEERFQPGAGRLDLLFQDAELDVRYEVEIQLGRTDETHIIRTIEYWDIERKRYPRYDHVAVLVAEDITSRFLNVISLFNGVIPLVAIQIAALQVGEYVSLVTTTVLDQRELGLVGQEDEEEREVADRAYWEGRGTPETVGMADRVLDIARTIDEALELKYNKFYIGLTKDARPCNFVILRPQKRAMRLEARLKRNDEIETLLGDAGLDLMDYAKPGRYRIRLVKGDVERHQAVLGDVLRRAYEEYEVW